MYTVSKLQGIEELQKKLSKLPNLFNRATASTLNKLGAQGVTEANRSIRETYNIKAGDVRKAITRVPAKAAYSGKEARLFTVITVQGQRVGLHKFGGLPQSPASQIGVPIKRRKAPTVKVMKTEPRRPVYEDPKTGHAAFVARMPTGHIGIFIRKTKTAPGHWIRKKGQTIWTPSGRHQIIKELNDMGIAELFLAKGQAAVNEMVRQRGSTMLQREVEFYLKSLGEYGQMSLFNK